MGLEAIVSKRKEWTYRSGRSSDWLKSKSPARAAVKREAEEDGGERDGAEQLRTGAYPTCGIF
jgi:ATP-dependent DNA ligase